MGGVDLALIWWVRVGWSGVFIGKNLLDQLSGTNYQGSLAKCESAVFTKKVSK